MKGAFTSHGRGKLINATNNFQICYQLVCFRFDQPAPGMLIRPPGPAPGMAPSQPPLQHAVDGSPAYSGTRFQSAGMRSQGADVSGQYPQPGNAYQNQGGYPGPQYPGYPPNAVGPRPPPGSGGMYGTPTKRFSDDPPG